MSRMETRASELLTALVGPFGLRAAMKDLGNYRAVFSRDAVMCGIAGMISNNPTVVHGLSASLDLLEAHQGDLGQIPSNVHPPEPGSQVPKVSYGTLSPKLDACTWYIIGSVLLDRYLQRAPSRFESISQAFAVLGAWEYNGKHLVYVPTGGNWADEYPIDGYTLYDQVLRCWALRLASEHFGRTDWEVKSRAVGEQIRLQFSDHDRPYLRSNVKPGGGMDVFDLAAHSLLGFALGWNDPLVGQALAWVQAQFLSEGTLPPAFSPTIHQGDPHWKALRSFHLYGFKNAPHHYHNGGIWWIWLGWLAWALRSTGQSAGLADLHSLTNRWLTDHPTFDFHEYIASDTLAPGGTPQLGFSAAGILMIHSSRPEQPLGLNLQEV